MAMARDKLGVRGSTYATTVIRAALRVYIERESERDTEVARLNVKEAQAVYDDLETEYGSKILCNHFCKMSDLMIDDT